MRGPLCAVRCDAVAYRGRINGMNDPCRDCRRESVEHHRYAFMPCRNDGTDTRRKFATAKAPQCFKGIGQMAAMQCQRPADQLDPPFGTQ